jgi:hypothetical protein
MKSTMVFTLLALLVPVAHGQDSWAHQHSVIVLHAQVPEYQPLAIEGCLSGTVHLYALVEMAQ